MKMTCGRVFCFVFVLACLFSLALSDNSSKNNKGSPDTKIYYSASELALDHGNQSAGNLRNDNETILQLAYPDDDTGNAIVIGRIIGICIAVLAVLVVGCIIACCPCCCRKEQRGVIIGGGIPKPEFQLPQQHNQQIFVAQQNPTGNNLQQFPPPYDTQAVQHQQYSSVQQQHSQYSPVRQEQQHSPMQQQPQQPPVNPNTYNPPSDVPVYNKY